MYKIVIKNNIYKKVSPSLKKDIDEALRKLIFLISEKESYGEKFERIFNNPTIKYDIFSNNFFTFKHHSHDSAQLRLLYRFIRNENGEVVIELHNYHHKKQNNKKYIKAFEQIAQTYKN